MDRQFLQHCYNSDSHSSSTTGATATIAFTGTRILLYSAYDTSSGIMGVTLSDSSGTAVTPEVQVSLRSDAPATGNYLVYCQPHRCQADHMCSRSG